MISLTRLRPIHGRWTRIKFVSGLTGLNEAFRHSWYQSKVREVEMADRRDWGGGGEDPEESTQCMIERIWESLTDIRMRMDQQAPVPPAAVPPVAEVPVAPVAPPQRVEVPYVAPVPPPVMAAEEPKPQPDRTAVSFARPWEGELRRFPVEIRVFGVLVPWEARVEREKLRGSVVSRVLRELLYVVGKRCVPLCFHGRVYDIPYEVSACSREADSDQVR
ncbi:hypothetical protein Taro_042538 [Colocasia esculenta]|uniref:Uncharacterized protein n=1 Tax=Colocasia esculenta TaxID=4460 RepID=A0A843WWS0_COLES|nr:hypothetical protein [Colocasia esculenta]